MKKFVVVLTLLMSYSSVWSSDYDEAWKALNVNDREKAKSLLMKTFSDKKDGFDAYLTYIYMMGFESKSTQVKDFTEKAYLPGLNPYPYIFALWFDDAVLGGYAKKLPQQLKLAEKIFNDPKTNGSIKSALHYSMAFHYMELNDFESARKEWAKIGSIQNWQFTGSFENISQTGFDKMCDPIFKPEESAVFKSYNNSDIKWFTPAVPQNDGWVSPKFNITVRTGTVYAQSYVFSPVDQKVLLCAGGNGSMKVWTNDQLVIAEAKERGEKGTELDAYKNYCNLRKGYNRVLVQLAFTNADYPNFMIRLTDSLYNTIPSLTYGTKYQDCPLPSSQIPSVFPVTIPLFAESYFEQKIKTEPSNLINYLLESDVLMRNQKNYEARKLLEKAQNIAPDNSLIRYKLITCLNRTENRTRTSEEFEKIKEKDPLCQFSLLAKVEELSNRKQYTEEDELLNQYIKIYGRDETALNYKIGILANQEKTEEMIAVVNEAYKNFPTEPTFIKIMFKLKKDSYKDVKGALKVYEDYLKLKYDPSCAKELAEEYFQQGMASKGLPILEKIQKEFSYDPESTMPLATYYYNKQDYKKSIEYCNLTLQQNPTNPTYWSNLGTIYFDQNKKDLSLESFIKSIHYGPNQFSVHQKVRELENKPELWKAFADKEMYEQIKTSNESYADQGYYYLENNEYSIVYPEGTNEKEVVICLKILNQEGIDYWKTVHVPYNSNTQDLVIEKSELVKKNGNKITAEVNENEMVFANIEVGDAVYIKYKIQNYAYGRLAKEFWDKYNFNKFKPVQQARYSLLIANNIKFNYKMVNGTVEPVITKLDDEFTMYTWEMKNLPAMKREPYMPSLNDVGAVLHISSVNSWQDIASWYADLSYRKNQEDQEVQEIYNSLFEQGKTWSDMEKARIIYNYIGNNMSYSSVAFRQSAYVPQSAAKTITTRLGDCKDLSSLYVTLARMAGLKANLVLVDTRDNGIRDMVLPSFEFNHCIANVTLNNKEYFLELTDKNLPFGSLSYEEYGALILKIPYVNSNEKDSLSQLFTSTRSLDKTRRNVTIEPDGKDLVITENVHLSGSAVSGVREKYRTMTEEKQKEEFEKAVNERYKKQVQLNTVLFKNLMENQDSLDYSYSYVVRDGLIEIADVKSVQLNFADQVASLDKFITDQRTYPVDYWKYEDKDIYETEIKIKSKGPANGKLPKNITTTFGKSSYSLNYKLEPDGFIKIHRKSVLVRNDVAPEQYGDFKKFLKEIISAESAYIVL